MLAHITMLHGGNRDGGGLSNVNKRDSSVAAGSSLPIISELSVLQDGWDLKYLDDFRRRSGNDCRGPEKPVITGFSKA